MASGPLIVGNSCQKVGEGGREVFHSLVKMLSKNNVNEGGGQVIHWAVEQCSKREVCEGGREGVDSVVEIPPKYELSEGWRKLFLDRVVEEVSQSEAFNFGREF